MRKNKLLLLLLLIFVSPFKVFALTGDILIECDMNKLIPEQKTNCLIKGENFSEKISSFHAEIILDDGLEINSSSVDSSWEGSMSGGIIDLYTDVNKSGNINFASFVVKANDGSFGVKKIKLTDIVISDSNFNEFNLDEQIFSLELESNSSDDDSDDKINDTSDPDDVGTGEIGDTVLDNPSTGNLKFISIVMIVLFISLILILYYKKELSEKK